MTRANRVSLVPFVKSRVDFVQEFLVTSSMERVYRHALMDTILTAVMYHVTVQDVSRAIGSLENVLTVSMVYGVMTVPSLVAQLAQRPPMAIFTARKKTGNAQWRRVFPDSILTIVLQNAIGTACLTIYPISTVIFSPVFAEMGVSMDILTIIVTFLAVVIVWGESVREMVNA